MMKATATALTGIALISSLSLNVAQTAAMVAERSKPAVAAPAVMSIRIRDEDVAHDMWQEAMSIGESVCLTELSDGGLRYWLHSCERPGFTNGSN